jgi:hypothetical protein
MSAAGEKRVRPSNANSNSNAEDVKRGRIGVESEFAMVPYNPVEIANSAIDGSVDAYSMIVENENVARALAHYENNANRSMAIGIQMRARVTNTQAREAILKQDLVSNAANKSYLSVLHMLEDVEKMRYIPPPSQENIRKLINIYIPTDIKGDMRKKLNEEVIILLDKEQAAGDRCAGSLMNTFPFLLAAYGTIKHAVRSGEFSKRLNSINKDVESVFHSFRLFKKYYDDKEAQNVDYNKHLSEIQARILGQLGRDSSAPTFPPRIPVHDSTNAIGSEYEANMGEDVGWKGFVFGTKTKVKITNSLPQIYGLINFLAIMFPDIAFKCYMVIPEKLSDIPSFYNKYDKLSYEVSKDYFTKGTTVERERIVGIEGNRVEKREEEEEFKCTREDMLASLGNLTELDAGDSNLLKTIAGKIFDFGCFIGTKLVAGGAGAQNAIVHEISEIAEDVAVPAAQADVDLGKELAAAESQLENGQELEEAAVAALMNMGANTNFTGGQRSKIRKSKHQRRITRNRKKNLRLTRSRLSRKFM